MVRSCPSVDDLNSVNAFLVVFGGTPIPASVPKLRQPPANATAVDENKKPSAAVSPSAEGRQVCHPILGCKPSM